ncbi:MAG: class I SAM-dependent rRNA methyltransferase, partial [Gammaproteobacteria bacterium]
MSHPRLFLRKKEDKRLLKGHLWVFSNEVETDRSPLDGFAPGDTVNVCAADGKVLGSAYINPNTLICARLLSSRIDLSVDTDFFIGRLKTALALREKLYDKPFYRLVFGESDGLPGLVVDRFGAVLSVQITTAGMERHKSELLEALVETLRPDAIVLKNDNSQRQLEALPMENETAYGRLPETLIIEENRARFAIDIVGGQKTGWFYDHRDSRARCAALCRGRSVLDLFSYTGAWGIPGALAGASSVTCVDASAAALQLAAENAGLNGVGDKIRTIESDVFDFLKHARSERQLYDIVI